MIVANENILLIVNARAIPYYIIIHHWNVLCSFISYPGILPVFSLNNNKWKPGLPENVGPEKLTKLVMR